MSDQNNQAYIQELQQSLQQLQGETQAQFQFAAEVQQIITDIQGLISSSNNIFQNGNVERNQLQELREKFTNKRVSLQNFRDDLRNREDQVVQAYRTTLGEYKNTFETLTMNKQNEENPLAFQSLQEYRLIEQLDETLGKVNGNLMDLSHQLELHYYSQQPSTEIKLEETIENGPDPKYPSP